jgi:hypothetical protein
MATLYKQLGDSFDRHDGALIGYTKNGLTTALPVSEHYDLRSFHNRDIAVKWTMLNMQFWNAFHFEGMEMDEFNNPHSIIGAETRRRVMDDLSVAVDGGGTDTTYFTMAQLDALTIDALSFLQVSLGNEDWPVGDPDVIIGRDSAYKYANTFRVNNVVAASTKTVTSSFFDDILTDFNSGGSAFIELVLRNFPAQAASNKLDLANSFIDFSSSETFEAGVTTSVPFNASLNDLTGGGDVVFKINRNTLLPNVTLTSVRGIRFRLKAIGAGSITFIAQAMRLYEQNLSTFDPIAVDTKKKYLMKSAPQQTENLIANSSFEPVLSGTGGPHAGSTANWAGSGTFLAGTSTLAATSTEQFRGSYALSVTTPGGVTGQGAQSAAMVKDASTNYRAQARVKGPNGATLNLIIQDGAGSSANSFTCNGTWQHIVTSPLGTTDGTDDLVVTVETRSTAQAITFYVDAVMVMRATDPSPGPYADSDDTAYGVIFHDESRPKNITTVTKFHSGHNPTGSVPNTLRQYFRYQTNGDHIRVDMDARTAECRLRIYERVSGVTTEVYSTNASADRLADERDYFLVTELKDSKVKASIYTGSGLPNIGAVPTTNLNGAVTLPNATITVDDTTDFPTSGQIRINAQYVTYTGKTATTFTGCTGGTGIQADNTEVICISSPQLRTTDWRTVTGTSRGRVGFSFEPFNYDFYVEYLQPTNTEFAEVRTTSLPSVRNLRGATLYRHDSGYFDVGENEPLIASGDGFMTTDTGTGNPAPSRKIVRAGNAWFGGVEYGDTVFTGNTKNLVIRGSIYPLNARGLWRVALVDEFGNCGYLARVEGFLKNTWNNFEVPINADLAPTKWFLLVHQAGFFDDTFYVDNLRLDHNSVSWEASANNGSSFIAFQNVSDSKYNSLRFPPSHQGNKLKLRGIAQADRAWVQGYEVEPIYIY